MFSALGRFSYRARVWVLVATALFAVAAATWGSGVFAAVSEGGFTDPGAESARATDTVEDGLGRDAADVVAVYRSDDLRVNDPEFASTVRDTVDDLPDAHVERATTYRDQGLGQAERGALISEDRHATYVAITLTGDTEQDRMDDFGAIEGDLSADGLDTHIGGPIAVQHDLQQRAESDIVRAEAVSLPVLLVLLVVIFGGVVAAGMPLAIGGLAIVGSLVLLRALAQVTDVSVFAINVATLLGLGLAIDYGLFIVSRFREEIARGREPRDALPRTLATAGRTVAFSGVTVMISFGGLLFFPQPILRSLGLGGMAVVLFDVLAALVVLPALLAVVGRRIDALRLPMLGRRGAAGPAASRGYWNRLAHGVMRRPTRYVVGVGAVLLVLASALVFTDPGSTDDRYLPSDSDSRVATQELEDDFPAGANGQVDVAVTGDLDRASLDDYTQRLADLEGAAGASVERADGETAHLRVPYDGGTDDPETIDLVHDVRAERAPDGADTVLVGGAAAERVDNVDAILDAVPLALVFVVAVTGVLLFLAFGSVVLPLKAVLMGFLSLGASLGVVIWGFQEGHLASALGFDAVGTIDPTYLVLILVVAFGLAMDYELFLLSRVREEYLATGDNARSVATGLQRTGRIITSAAVLLVVVLVAMGVSDLLFLKIVGIGLAVAVLVDATLVRAVLVPATMRLLGRANWWLPGPLRRLHTRVGLTETEGDGDPARGPERVPAGRAG